jgi:hypothetical protein
MANIDMTAINENSKFAHGTIEKRMINFAG